MKKQTRVLADTEQWSEPSKRSAGGGYGYVNGYYHDIHYTCTKCRSPAVFTAEEQKYSFEVQKNYIWQQRFLCGKCFLILSGLRNKHNKFEHRWLLCKNTLQSDKQFINQWLNVIDEIASYNVNVNYAMRIHLKKLLELLPSE